MLKRNFALLLCITMLVCLFAGCKGEPAKESSADASTTSTSTGDTSTDSTVTTDVDAPVEIRAGWWGDTNRHDLYNEIIDGFTAQYPNITVVREPASWNDYWDKLAVQTAGGNAPDFIGMHVQYAADYIARGSLEPLDSYIADGTLDLTGWRENIVNTGNINGVQYMLPMGITYSSTFVNEGLLEELDIPVPTTDWTWDDLKSIGAEAREKLDAAGKTNAWLISDGTTNYAFWRYYIRQQGRELFDENGNVGFTVEDAQSYWEMYSELRALGIIPDAATTTEYATATLEDSLFARDMVLTASVPLNQYKVYCSTFPEKEISLVRNPTAEGKAAGEFPEGAAFAISSSSSDEKKQAAALLMNYWLNTEESLALFGLDQGIPANEDLQGAYKSSLDAYQQTVLDFATNLSAVATPSTIAPKGASEVENLFKSIAEQVQFDQMTPADAAQKLYDEAVAVVEKNKAE